MLTTKRMLFMYSLANMGIVRVVVCFFLVQLLSKDIWATDLPFPVNAPNQLLNKDSIDSWIEVHDLALILFCNEVAFSQSDPAQLVEKFQDVGETLNRHDVFFAVYNCADDPDPDNSECGASDNPGGVAVYRKGAYLTTMSADALYNDYSIISNTFQLMFLEEVPMIQDVEHLAEEMLGAVSRGYDFLLMVTYAIGNREHAEFMLAASYLTQRDDDSYMRFAQTTNAEIVDKINSVSLASTNMAKALEAADNTNQIYFAKCDGLTLTEGVKCPLYTYIGKFDETSIKRYAKILQTKGPRDKIPDLYMPVVSCFYESESEKATVEKEVNHMSEEMKGSALFYALNVDQGTEEEVDTYKKEGVGCFVNDLELGIQEEYVLLDRVYHFLKTKVLKAKVSVAQERAENPHDKIDALIDAVETLDDSVEIEDSIKYGGKIKMDLSHLVVLDRDSFKPKQHDGIVLFHIMKYDHYSRYVLRMFNSTAVSLPDHKHKFQVMNCYDWTDVCKQINVTQYPTIKFYKDGRSYNYKGPISTESLSKLAQLSSFHAPQPAKTMQDVMKARKAFVDSALDLDIIIGLFKDEGKEYRAYRRAAIQLVGQKPMLVATGEFAEQMQQRFKLSPVPVIISYNPGEKNPAKAVKAFEKPVFTHTAIEEFALKSRLPAFVELTVDTLPVVYKSSRPILILFTNEITSSLFAMLAEHAKDADLVNKFTFSYMQMTEGNLVNGRILESLTASMDHPALLVADYGQGKIYKKPDVSDASAADIKSWLQQITIGNVVPSKIIPEGDWKPLHPGYDYLEMIEQDKHRVQPDHDRLNIFPKTPTGGETAEDAEPIPEPATVTTEKPKHTEL